MIVRLLLALLMASTSAVACGQRTAPGCSKDTDCKGDRVCMSGECRDQDPGRAAKQTPTADPSQPSDMEKWADELCACRDQECVDTVNKKWEGKMNGKLHNMSDTDSTAFTRALDCSLKYLKK